MNNFLEFVGFLISKSDGPIDVFGAAAAAAKSLQSCPTLCDPIYGSPPGSAVPGIFQVRTLEWVAISLSNAWKWKVKVKSLSHVRLFPTPWTAAYQAPPSMEFSRQEYWSGAIWGTCTFETDLIMRITGFFFRGCVWSKIVERLGDGEQSWISPVTVLSSCWELPILIVSIQGKKRGEKKTPQARPRSSCIWMWICRLTLSANHGSNHFTL